MKFFCIPIFTCKNQIDALDYSCMGLEQIPEEVLKSKRIEELCLNSNAIDQLPPAFFKLTKLRRLELNYNKLRTIPAEIGLLRELIELDLSKNELSDLPEEMAGCSSLQILDVSTNILPNLPKSIVNLSTLTHLNVSDTSLTQLPADIHRMTSLKFLDARECELRFLPENIVELTNLQRLDLGVNTIIELPPNMGKMKNLRELDLEQNMLMSLHEDLLNCTSLESIVLCSNSINELPEDIGRLENLNELNITQNELSKFPNSIGRLKNLKILKASHNNISELTPAISSIDELEELELSHNQLKSIPSAIGNLKKLRFLYLASNKLRDIPTTIGGCTSLGVLNVRNNEIDELPMEVGKLSRLKVLDVVDNNLTYLPYTLTVLKDTLTAIWLSVNQNTQLPKLSIVQEPVTRVKVLTCYLLPQKGQNATARREPNKSCVGGAKVHFDANIPASEQSIEEDEEEKKPVGDFQRYDTPHPKQHAPKYQKFLQAQRNSGDFSTIMAGEQKGNEVDAQAGEEAPQVEMRPLRSVLKRRPVSTASNISQPEIAHSSTTPTPRSSAPTVKTIIVKRGPNGLGWHVAGGIDSEPVKGTDRGIYISKVNPNGAAEEAGLKKDDKILSVNGKSLENMAHNDAVQIIRESGDTVELVIERQDNEEGAEKASIFKHEQPSCNGSMSSLPSVDASMRALPPTIPSTPASRSQQQATELIAVTIRRDFDGSPGFSISGGFAAEPIRISSITAGGAAERTGKLKVGDRILSVNGQNVKFCRQDQVVTMLTGIENEIYLCVEREVKAEDNFLKPKLTPSRSLPSIHQEFSSSDIYAMITGAYKKPNASKEQTTTASQVMKTRSTTHLNFIDDKVDSIDLPNIERDALASPQPKPRSTVIGPTSPHVPPHRTHPSSTSYGFKLEDLRPQATSTPIPESHKPIVQSSSKIPMASKIPPPVAPKPKVAPEKPEVLNFTSKIKKFEEEINAQSQIAKPSTSVKNAHPPPKKPLVSAQDLKTIKADEEAKIAKILAKDEGVDEEGIVRSTGKPAKSPDQEFEHLLNDSPVPITKPAIVRTKKAEIRAEKAAAAELQRNLSFTSTTSNLDSSIQLEIDEASSTLSPLERRALELEKKREWRQARLKSIEAASKHADEVMNEIRQLSRLSNISEDLTHSLQPSPIPTT